MNILPEVVQGQALASWYSESSLARQAVDPRFSFFVAIDGEQRLVGFAMMAPRPQPGEAELLRFGFTDVREYADEPFGHSTTALELALDLS